MYSIIHVPGQDFEIYEQLGTKQKFWYDDFKFLFKRGREGTGENWAEVAAAAIAGRLRLPHATYSLAQTRVGEELWNGVITPNFVPPGARLVLGNELIMPVSTSERASKQDRQAHHTVHRLVAILKIQQLRPPIGWEEPESSARRAMAGYLLLDALIGNQDRHEENWGLIVVPRPTGIDVHLAPTFDHASSLGRNELDATRSLKLAATRPEHGIEGYAAKANSQLYDRAGRRLRTIEAFTELTNTDLESREFWLGRLSELDEEFFRGVFDQFSDAWISGPAKEFAIALLLNNRRKLLELNA